ncbi:MAG: hypothetical protein ACLFQP_08080 [Halothece sp.]
MATKRSKATKGFKELKKTNAKSEMALTATENEFLEQISNKLGVTVSDVLDHLATGKIAVKAHHPEMTIAVKMTDGTTPSVEVLTEETVIPEQVKELQSQLQAKETKIAQLEKQVAQQETLQETYQTVSLQSEQQLLYIQELEEARRSETESKGSRHRQEIQQLNQQLSQLQAQLAREQSQHQTEIAAKDKQIEALQAHLAHLESFANIGERQLNRWRSQSIQ